MSWTLRREIASTRHFFCFSEYLLPPVRDDHRALRQGMRQITYERRVASIPEFDR